MEDRYLFKAKRVDDGDWLVGYVVKYGHTGKEKYYIIPSYASDLYAIEVDPSTICQCTGLKDKNGNLIWENDIVKGKYYDGGKAYEHMGQIKYYCQSYKVVGINQYKGYHAELDGLYETVGNIFDNTELLESEG